MKDNSDRQLASDFDDHLKMTMNQLTIDIKKTGSQAN